MKERSAEVRRAKRRGPQRPAYAEREALAGMADAHPVLNERVHALVMASAPDLTSRTSYGMPAYADDGQLICFFQPARKSRARYATLGFDENAHLDEGTMWPTAFAPRRLTKRDEARIAELVPKALG
jgi:uncharacterized protein YdhG (YjbR/CyaY superfamily)